METVRTEPNGMKVTRAMWFGELMHRVALSCAQERLSEFLQGRFHLEPRYRRHPKTGELEWRIYPRGHPYQGRSQDAVYRELLGAVPRRVQPRLGVEP